MNHPNEPLENFKKTIDAEMERIRGTTGGATSLPDTIYHYTDVRGALGILTAGGFWFTERTHLNDTSEIKYGIDSAVKVISASEVNLNSGRKDQFAMSLRKGLDDSLPKFGIYVGSFTAANDDLGQWRNYADEGRGVALGFARTAFDHTASECDGLTQFGRYSIRYGDDAITQELRTSVDEALKLLNGQDLDFEKEVAKKLAVLVLYASLLFKHVAYSHEKEFRVLVVDNRDQIGKHKLHRTRERLREIVDYLDCPFRPPLHQGGVLTHIRIGPAASKQLMPQFCKTIGSLGIPEPTIDKSDIPFRPTR
jgi:hypothetical protein